MVDSKCILIVEDNDSIRLLLGSMLRKKYEVITKKDGLEAMAWLVAGHLPDLILLDMSMPRLNGTEFLKSIRQSGFFKDIPVIVLSGNDGEQEIKDCLKWGVSHYLTKPFNPISLKELIHVIFSSRLEKLAN